MQVLDIFESLPLIMDTTNHVQSKYPKYLSKFKLLHLQVLKTFSNGNLDEGP
jgi:hypothetical protein